VLPRPLIRFNALTSEAMKQSVVVVASDVDQEFEITEVESSVPYLTTSFRKLSGDERLSGHSETQYEVSISLDDDVQVGPVSGRLAVYTDHPQAPRVPIRVYGVVRALLHVTPPQIQFGTVDAKAKPGRNVIVVSNRTEGEATEITGVSVNDPAFSADVKPIKAGQRFQITVTIDPEAGSGVREAVLTVKTNDPEFAEIEVPVRAKIR
jgi:hypothetical protein